MRRSLVTLPNENVVRVIRPGRAGKLVRVTGNPHRRSVLVSFCLAALLVNTRFSWGEEIDRLLAGVNGKVITEGDLSLSRNLNALLALGKDEVERTRDQELNRLIDLELLRQELEHFLATRAEESEVQQKVDELKEAYVEIGGLPGLLRRLGLQESELRSYIALRISFEKFVRFRFRPFVSVSPDQKLAYYQEELVPKLQRSPGTRIPPLEEVAPQIEEFLTEREVNSAVERWLGDIRGHSRIEFFARAAGSQEGASR